MNDTPEVSSFLLTEAFLSGVIVGIAITVLLIMIFRRLRLRGKLLLLCALVSLACLLYFNADLIRPVLINLLPEDPEQTILQKLKRPH